MKERCIQIMEDPNVGKRRLDISREDTYDESMALESQQELVDEGILSPI